MSDQTSPSGDDGFPDRDLSDNAGGDSSAGGDPSATVPDVSLATGPDIGPVLEGDDGEIHPPGLKRAKPSGQAGRRLVGMLALLLGLIGSVLSVVAALSSVAAGFGADDNAARLVAPIEASVDRLEVRVDQTDDLMTPSGVASGDQGELEARVDGLVDLTTAASQAFVTIDEHPVYGRLPVDIDDLGESLADLDEEALAMEAELDSAGASGLTARSAEVIAGQLNTMQSSFSTVQDEIGAADASLTSWARLGSLAGFVLSLWSLWGQTWLARRGWRGLRALDP